MVGSFHYNSTNGEHPYLLKFDYVLMICDVFKTDLILAGIFLISFFVFEILRFKNLHFFYLWRLSAKQFWTFYVTFYQFFSPRCQFIWFWGQGIQKCSQICVNINRKKKVRGKNHIASSEPPHHFMIQYF